MKNGRNAVGESLRRLRQDRQLSLGEVAGQAGISVATLSRVENSKQAIDVDLLVSLSGILGVPASEVLRDDGDGNDVAALSARMSRLRPSDRMKVFLDSSRRHRKESIAAAVDDLLSTVNVLRDELISVQRAARRRKG